MKVNLSPEQKRYITKIKKILQEPVGDRFASRYRCFVPGNGPFSSVERERIVTKRMGRVKWDEVGQIVLFFVRNKQ